VQDCQARKGKAIFANFCKNKTNIFILNFLGELKSCLEGHFDHECDAVLKSKSILNTGLIPNTSELKMDQRRYFTNPFIDSNENAGAPSRLDIKQRVLVTTHLVLTHGNNSDYDGGIYVGPAGLTYLAIHLLRHPKLLTAYERQKITEMGKTALDNHLNYYDKRSEDK